MWDSTTLFSIIGTLGVIAVAVFTNSLRFFTIREHDAYLRAQDEALEALDKRLEDMLDRIKALEHTRPTTGELKAWVTRQLNGQSGH